MHNKKVLLAIILSIIIAITVNIILSMIDDNHCDHIVPLITTEFGLKVVQARANNFYYWFSGPKVHFEGNNKLNRPKLAKKCLGRTCFGDSCGLIYNPNSQNLVSNRRRLKKKQIPFSPLLSETISGCPKFELCPKIENLRLLCTKITT